eukprot:CAMPEP_0195285140 /NCGR_PEP_ID=MMETSP0707-20130614/3086_1 /TAXON_ID=33640 /ORGANISM="Asterionellopsis glacialis, Strain CCMP134" /LENGTH=411 /DNA_ID=CAMNT_0040344593 /DNA_START=154 /DNA_END=1389 /DNA_ORIENTATION=+
MSDSDSRPSVLISGGGPSGILSAILFADLGVNATVIEKAKEPDQWSTKSYTMVISEKGQSSLERGNCLELAKEIALPRKFVYFVDGNSGAKKGMPKKSPGLGFSRPLLVECLEKVASKSPNITIQRGAGVSKVITNVDTGDVEVHLDNDTVLSASHVVGADGKWSKVRASYPSLSSQGNIERCRSFGIHMMAKLPEDWANDGTYVIRPSPECKFYIIASPIHTGELSISMVCYHETVERYPFLAPPKDDMDSTKYGKGGWEDEYSALPQNESDSSDEGTLAQNLADLFEKEIPAFADAIGKESFKTARVNRCVSWLHMEADDVTYTAENGRVTLIGDAAHAVTPSMGEGCNTAMESAVKLVDEVKTTMKENETLECTKEILSKAFVNYGKSRPGEVIPIQEKSAAASNTMR